MDVSIILTVRQAMGDPRVELEGECENQNGVGAVLELTKLIHEIVTLTKEFDGELLPETKELPLNKFYLVMEFPSDENKRLFLGKLPTAQ